MSKLIYRHNSDPVDKAGERLDRAVLTTGTEVDFNELLHFIPDAAFAVNTDGVVIAWNPAMEELTRIEAAAMLGRGNFEYAIPYYGYRRPMLVDLILKPSRVLEKNYPNFTSCGETVQSELFVPSLPPSGRHLSAKAGPLRDSTGRLIGAIETTRDVSATKQLEQDLVEAKRRLEREQQVLEHKNSALQEILSQIEAEKRVVVERVQRNIDRLVRPLLRQMLSRVSPEDQKQLAVVNQQLDEITAPFVHRLETRFATLSPRQAEICDLIRRGLSCKEIAAQFDTSVYTVLNQRQEIRRKLGLRGANVNLMTYLKSV